MATQCPECGADWSDGVTCEENFYRFGYWELADLFLSARSERQVEAAQHIQKALRTYDVEAIDTLIGDINPPAQPMQTLTDRKIAEEQRKTYEVQEQAQIQRQQLVRQTELADIQQQVVKSEQGVNIADLLAQAAIKQANGEAEAIRVTGEAQAESYKLGAEAMGAQGYTAVQLMQIVGDRSVRIIPDIMVNGGKDGSGSLVDALLGIVLRDQMGQPKPIAPQTNGSPAVTLTPPSTLPEQ